MVQAHMPPFTSLDEQATPKQTDMVNSPPHYNQGEIECIQAIKAMLGPEQYKSYCQGTVMKYVWRLNYKGKPLQDAKKAQWYLNQLINELEGNQK